MLATTALSGRHRTLLALIVALLPWCPAAAASHDDVGAAHDRGPACHIVVALDVRIAVGAGRADGVVVAWLDTGVYGQGGAPVPPALAGEPDFARSLGFGFGVDRHDDLDRNRVSIHFDGARVARVDAGTVDLASGDWVHAEIEVDLAGAAVSVTLTAAGGAPVALVVDRPVPGLEPYQGRLHLGTDHDVDNLAVTVTGCPPSRVGRWGPVLPWPAVAIHAHLLPTGEVMFWDRQDVVDGDARGRVAQQTGGTFPEGAHEEGGTSQQAGGTSRKKGGTFPGTPGTSRKKGGTFPGTPGTPQQMGGTFPEEGGTSQQAGGTSRKEGGTSRKEGGTFHGSLEGDTTPWIWNPETGQLRAAQPPAAYDLFCTGHTLLADGRLHVAGGHLADHVGLAAAAYYDPWADRWTALPEMAAGRWYPTHTLLADGDVLVVSGDVDVVAGVNTLPEVWQVAANTWRPLSMAHKALPLYPYMYLLADGRVFAAGPQQETCILDTAGQGHWSACRPSGFGDRDYGSSVMFDQDRILIVGGGFDPTASAEVIDLGAAAPAWRFVEPMAYRRRQQNATLLADGTVLVTGGTSAEGFNDATGAVAIAELWDPKTEGWTRMAAMAETRIYHSIALLLPDGRVLSAGGGHPSDLAHGDPDHFDAEVYQPPYLFRGPRPTITSAPARVRYGETFSVATPDGASIAAVHALRLGSVTHAFNQSQRINRLPFAASAEGLAVTAPADPRRCPPGHHMLFLIDGAGVPSVAAIVELLPESIFADGFASGDTAAWPVTVGGG